ncbi:hypothetical protein FHU41_001833 [Psychromicrobium silvestre]|uniref:DUF600 family protein n=1 Tax=Psychromicrobium silvestre TaxID=1645614 RepID=A0A7Y9S6R0_9MICC|nr:hypothetical protein [Psychromicrobium silvestre]NYE95583.1 hypothetical protein [Psychromicrobium silvestre]
MNENIMKLQTDLGNFLVSALATSDWSKIIVFYAEVGNISQSQCDYIDSAGETQHASMPVGALDILEEMKSAFSQEGRGTWLSAEVTVDRSTTEIKLKFNYDDKPNWHIEPQPENYLLDLQRYPRTEVGIPEWYPKFEDYPNWQDELSR